MSSPWLSIDNNFPSITGSEGLRDQVRMIHDFLPILIECLKFQLSNLGVNNWNKTEMESFQAETTENVENAIDATDKELAYAIRDLEEISSRMNDIIQRFGGVESDIGYLEEWKENVSPKVGEMEKAINDLTADVDVIEQVLKEGDEGISLGKEGTVLNLVGTVYINGVLYEG